jgi:hypothetical protein
MQKELAAREAALKKQVEGQMTALALGAMDRVKREAKAVKEAHDALAAALAAHQVEPLPRIPPPPRQQPPAAPEADGSAGPAARSRAPKLPCLRGDLGFSRGLGPKGWRSSNSLPAPSPESKEGHVGRS